jgi:protein-tyrosine phosphatase
MVRVLFVCMGNICRSPTAAGVFRALVEREGLAEVVVVDSAGTHAYHEGEGADRRAVHTAARRGIDLSEHVARGVRRADFDSFDFILAMDRDNLSELCGRAPAAARSRIRLFLEFADPDALGAPRPVIEVPDPYYGGPDGFDHVLDLIEAASAGLLVEIRRTLDSRLDER